MGKDLKEKQDGKSDEMSGERSVLLSHVVLPFSHSAISVVLIIMSVILTVFRLNYSPLLLLSVLL